MRLPTTPLLATATAALLLLGPAAAGAGTGTRRVVLQDIDFSPRVLRITRGTTVRWEWRDGDTPHNVRSRGALRFRSASTRTTGTYAVRFTRAGTYRYVCSIHPGMDGRVVVR